MYVENYSETAEKINIEKTRIGYVLIEKNRLTHIALEM
jgi:hypothetical protein